ncbi:MAG TPA: hypothetical protein VNI01_10290, partial [Elusimicrobiota bacterium]|nr:hypothetical protein [Elusimicrobiota bacterium]
PSRAHPLSSPAAFFDGAKARDEAGAQDATPGAAAAADEDAARAVVSAADGGASAAPEAVEIRFSADAKKKLLRSQVSTTVRLINGNGSRWYWGQFAQDSLLRVLSGGKTIFHTRILRGETKRISQITRKDLEGYYSNSYLYDKDGDHYVRSLDAVRERLMKDLASFTSPYRPAAPIVTPDSEVRVMGFMPFKDARKLPENIEEPQPAPRPRSAVEIPPMLTGLSRYLPKTVILDLRLFPAGLPFELLEDMGKLMKAGVYFVMLSDRPQEGPGSIKEQLTKGLTTSQRDQLAFYKLFFLGDNGNTFHEYKKAFSEALPFARFEGRDLEMMQAVAGAVGAKETLSNRGNLFSFALKKKADPKAAAAEFSSRLAKFGIRPESYVVETAEGDRPTVSLRPNDLPRAIPQVLATLRDRNGVYTNNSDLVVISRDPGVLAATQGAVQPARVSPLEGADLAEMSLAAMLGDYRENIPGDLAASASKIESFLDKRGASAFGGGGSIFMMVGHIMHTSFNWAMWVYRNTGKLPSNEELVAKAREIWDREDEASVGDMLKRAGRSMAESKATMENRLVHMYATLTDLLTRYPIVVGTELPNHFIFNRYKKGALDHRDILRFIFDLVVAREVAGGLELLVVDFKTGLNPALQGLSKSTQVQLYDLIVRQFWRTLPLPYGVTGAARDVLTTDPGPAFIYPNGLETPRLTNWTRAQFNSFLRNTMNRMRRHNAQFTAGAAPAPKAEKAKKKGRGKALGTKEASFDTLKLPAAVPGLKIRYKYAQQIVKGTKKIEYRTRSAEPKAFVAIIQTFTEEEPGRKAEVVGFARIEKVVKKGDNDYEWHLSNVTPVEPYL